MFHRSSYQNTVDTLIGEFHSYLSDDIIQYSSTTVAHITDIINILVANNIIIQNLSTIQEETDGCSKQNIFTSDQL